MPDLDIVPKLVQNRHNISNFAFGIPGFDQFSRDFASFQDSGILATRKPRNKPRN